MRWTHSPGIASSIATSLGTRRVNRSKILVGRVIPYERLGHGLAEGFDRAYISFDRSLRTRAKEEYITDRGHCAERQAEIAAEEFATEIADKAMSFERHAQSSPRQLIAGQRETC